MANTTKQNTTAKVDNTEKENKELKSQILEMQKQMEQMMAKMSQLNESNSAQVKDTEQFNYEYDVPVMNCSAGELNISTHGFGQGINYQFLEMGEIQDIPYGDLKKIIAKNRRFAENGVFYILDEKIVQKERLKSKYTKIFTLEEIMNAFNHKSQSLVEIYKLANDVQKKTIVNMIIDKKFNNEQLDKNTLFEIGEMCNKDLIGLINPMDIPEEGMK